jgi:hypothetical protein
MSEHRRIIEKSNKSISKRAFLKRSLACCKTTIVRWKQKISAGRLRLAGENLK